jgi:hypothetical protein
MTARVPKCAACAAGSCTDSVHQLDALLVEANAHVTFDYDRNVTYPCVVCGERFKSRSLVTIGVYTRRMPGNLQPGDAIVRPMCARCRDLTETQS